MRINTCFENIFGRLIGCSYTCGVQGNVASMLTNTNVMKTTTNNNSTIGGSIATVAIFGLFIGLLTVATLKGTDKVVGYEPVKTEQTAKVKYTTNKGITMHAEDFIELSNAQTENNEFSGLANQVKASKAETVTIHQAAGMTIVSF